MRSEHCVVLPHRSTPSKTRNAPRFISIRGGVSLIYVADVGVLEEGEHGGAIFRNVIGAFVFRWYGLVGGRTYVALGMRYGLWHACKYYVCMYVRTVYA